MMTEIGYLIDGKSCSGLEYVELIEDIFNRGSADTSIIELENGEGVSICGCSAFVSILHLKNDGSRWSPNENVTKKFAVSLIQAFIESDTDELSVHGAVLGSINDRKGIDFSEGGKINQILKRLFLCFLGSGLIVIIICGMSDAPNVLWAFGLTLFSLAMLILTCVGFTCMIDTYRYVSKSITASSSFKRVVAYFLLTCGLLFILIFSVISPLYFIFFLVWKIFKLVG